ncbi:efflux RND transporter periplasmic adaptor subunit [Halarcobacter anaerophilus]|jgi:membrane fusion protein (multidrug efflux system)|uniref:Efflux RND transporter periplasmic adaptor subunit n=1 Tax=Halarcobacter anaerophilus TaxID=877500 RepID=A0A4Q0Y290_9BACT|nr:efflux RND transporter periplasmic adaptor subunit [Halarcobacter anaerophilus]QDF27831.1 RND family efflux system, membrane fusion protein [Halarcobacter anaerophilus]RXJ64172.1 efflux RND transporter periplasmic adaptor subunit [Halarcobacter anaerophilus]
MKKFRSLLVVSALALTTISGNLLAEDAPAANQMPAPKADIYIVPKKQDLKIDLKYPAQIKSYLNAKVYSRVLGVLEEKRFVEGDRVEKGQSLFKIEDDLYQAKVDAAEASVMMNQATLNNATRNWNRIKKLYKSKAVSDEMRDNALSEYEEALGALGVAKAELRQAKIDLNYTKVKAPISGITSLKKVDSGNLVTQNPPMELVTITNNDKVYIDFSMPLSDYKNIQSGLWAIPKDKTINVKVTVDNKPVNVKGYVDFIDVNIEKDTSTVKMRALIDNKEKFLMPGNFVRISLDGIVQKNVITIPQKALLQNPLGTVVFVEKDGKAAVKPVIIGNESGDKYVVAGGPLQSGDRVIVNNFFRVKAGEPVAVDKIINK